MPLRFNWPKPYREAFTDDLQSEFDKIVSGFEYPDVDGLDITPYQRDRVCGAAAVHQYCLQNVEDTVPRGNEVLSPRETLEKGGRCVSQTALVGSLLNSVDEYSWGAVVVEKGDSDQRHAVPEFGVPVSESESLYDWSEVLDEFYQVNASRFSRWGGSVFFHRFEDHFFFPVDPIYSSHIGDISVHKEKGYGEKLSDIEFEWVDRQDQYDLFYLSKDEELVESEGFQSPFVTGEISLDFD